MPVSKYRLIIVQYFDGLTSDIDLVAEKELQSCQENEPKVNEINSRRQTLLDECKNVETICMTHLNQELANNPNQFNELDEQTLYEKLFKAFCFLINVSNQHYLVVTEAFLSNELLDSFRFLIKHNNQNIGDLALVNLKECPFHMINNIEGSFIEVSLNLPKSDLLKSVLVKASVNELFTIISIDLNLPIEIKPFARILFQNVHQLYIEFSSNVNFGRFTIEGYASQINVFHRCQSPCNNEKMQVKLESAIATNNTNDDNEDKNIQNLELSDFLKPLGPFNMHLLILYSYYENSRFNDWHDLSFSTMKGCTDLTTLMFKGFHVNRLKSNVFIHFKYLKYLNLTFMKLTEIETDALNGLEYLEDLDLSDNLIESFKDGSFDGLTRLKQFNLCDNKLTRLQANLFNKQSNLEVLSLNRNRITEPFDQDTFSGLRSLQILDLKEVPAAKQLNNESLVFKKHLANIKEIQFNSN